MRKFLVIGLLAVVSRTSAQDGMYGSFLVGQKFVDFSMINEELTKIEGVPEDLFPNNNWTFGGEGHLIIAKRLVLGGKAFGILHEKLIENPDPMLERRIRITSGMGIGTIGFNLTGENRFGIHLYPQVGVGASSVIYQSKRPMTEEQQQFDTVLVGTKDNIETLGKFGLIIDFAAGFDWYKPFKNFFTIVPGLDFGLMLHLEAGYSLLPGTLKWRRDFDLKGKDQVENGPDLKFNGFYVNVGFGLGLSAKD